MVSAEGRRGASSEVDVRKVDIRLPGKGNSNPHVARPVYSIHHDDEVHSDQLVGCE